MGTYERGSECPGNVQKCVELNKTKNEKNSAQIFFPFWLYQTKISRGEICLVLKHLLSASSYFLLFACYISHLRLNVTPTYQYYSAI